MKKILVLNGGGAKGVIQITVITELEKATGKQSWEIFDLIVGTSVGAINGAMHATGILETEKSHDLFLDILNKVFSHKHIFPPFYKDDAIQSAFDTFFGENFTMNQCKTKFMCTAVSVIDRVTHYFKSWEPKDGAAKLYDTIHRSFSAPIFFGQLVDAPNRQVWLDGGTGIANCPLIPAFEEANRQGWCKNDEQVLLLNIGTGYSVDYTPYEKAKEESHIAQAIDFLDPAQGGMARYQSTSYQQMALSHCSDIDLIIADAQIPSVLDKMDDIDQKDEYIAIGMRIFRDCILNNPGVLAKLTA